MLDMDLAIAIWNTRGLNTGVRRAVIFQAMAATGAKIVCLQETKMEIITPQIVRECLGVAFDGFLYLPVVGSR